MLFLGVKTRDTVTAAPRAGLAQKGCRWDRVNAWAITLAFPLPVKPACPRPNARPYRWASVLRKHPHEYTAMVPKTGCCVGRNHRDTEIAVTGYLACPVGD